MKPLSLALIGSALALGCGAPPEEGADPTDSTGDAADAPLDLGQVEQPVGIPRGASYYYGANVVTNDPHNHQRCIDGASLCTLPKTKGPTYCLQGLNATQQLASRDAFQAIDAVTNWTFTETTNCSTATIVVNTLDICFDRPNNDIESFVCVNLGEQGNTLTETPEVLPNTYTEHTSGFIHISEQAIAARTSDVTKKSAIRSHGIKAAILSWMGLGIRLLTDFSHVSSPADAHVLDPYVVTGLTAGEVCKLNKFLPVGQFGTSLTVGYDSSECAD